MSLRGLRRGLRDLLGSPQRRDLAPEQREGRRKRLERDGLGYFDYWPRAIKRAGQREDAERDRPSEDRRPAE